MNLCTRVTVNCVMELTFILSDESGEGVAEIANVSDISTTKDLMCVLRQVDDSSCVQLISSSRPSSGDIGN